MDQRPIFVAAHPRACSTAFERIFMTQPNKLTCVHEPFGDAFYYGPERMSERFEDDEQARFDSGFSQSTYQTILDRFEEESLKGKRLFIKDLIYYLVPPNSEVATLAPSIAHQAHKKRGVGTNGAGNGAQGGSDGIGFDPSCPTLVHPEPGNPTVIPEAVLKKFHFTFLIRHPRRSVPSYFRCTVPPLSEQTGFNKFMPSEMGYKELRVLFDFLRSAHHVGPEVAGRQYGPGVGFANGGSNGHANGLSNGHPNGHPNGHTNGAMGHESNSGSIESPPEVQICVIDADDLLEDPEGVVREFCKSADFDYDPNMLVWDTDEDHARAAEAFEKWKGWHNDVLESKRLTPRIQKKHPEKNAQQEYKEWEQKYGAEAARVIQKTVQENVEDYEYLKQFSLKLRN